MKKKYNKTIVFVEDDDMIRELYQELFCDFVENLFFAINGEEGIKLILEKKPDIIITDLDMPIMNGRIMMEKLRNEYNIQTTAFIVSASEDVEEVVESVGAGFCKKPMMVAGFKDKLKEFLED